MSDRLNISGSNPGKADIFNQIAQNSDRTQAEFQLGSPNSESGIFANTSPNSTAQGGDLTINTPLLQVQDGATISVSSSRQGQAGNLNITAKNHSSQPRKFDCENRNYWYSTRSKHPSKRCRFVIIAK